MTIIYYILRIPKHPKSCDGQAPGLVRHDIETGLTTFNVKDKRAIRFTSLSQAEKIARSIGAQVIRADNNEQVLP